MNNDYTRKRAELQKKIERLEHNNAVSRTSVNALGKAIGLLETSPRWAQTRELFAE